MMWWLALALAQEAEAEPTEAASAVAAASVRSGRSCSSNRTLAGTNSAATTCAGAWGCAHLLEAVGLSGRLGVGGDYSCHEAAHAKLEGALDQLSLDEEVPEDPAPEGEPAALAGDPGRGGARHRDL